MARAFVDTNVLVRFLTGEPPDTASLARQLFCDAESGKVTLVVDPITVAEVVWVLSSFYKAPRARVAEALAELLGNPGVESPDRDAITHALNLFTSLRVSFVDAFLAAKMMDEGEAFVYSLDHHFDRFPALRRLQPGEVPPP